jgi:hypothetical protein
MGLVYRERGGEERRRQKAKGKRQKAKGKRQGGPSWSFLRPDAAA